MFNRVSIIGNLGRNPEMTYSEQGMPITRFSVASSERWKGDDGRVFDRTTWFQVTVFGKQAESCNQYLSKGRKVYVEGRMNPDPTSGGPRIFRRQNGESGAAYEVVASRVLFLQSKSEVEAGGNERSEDIEEQVIEEVF